MLPLEKLACLQLRLRCSLKIQSWNDKGLGFSGIFALLSIPAFEQFVGHAAKYAGCYKVPHSKKKVLVSNLVLRGFQKIGVPFWGSLDKEVCVLGSTLRSPHFGKLPLLNTNRGVSCRHHLEVGPTVSTPNPTL